MAVNIVEIGQVYDALEAKITGTLTDQYDLGRLKGREYADVMAASMVALINSSVQTVQQQPLTDAQVLDMKVKDYATLANTQKDIELKDAQVATEQQRRASMVVEDAVKQSQSGADLATKAAQQDLISKQALTEAEKKLLTARQAKGFDDDAKQKLLKQVLDTWSVAYSVAQTAEAIPDTIKVDVIDSILKNATTALGVNITTNPIGIT